MSPEVHCAHAEMVPIGEMKPNPRNPNSHPHNQIRLLAAAIVTHGWRMPVTVSRRSGLVVRGHARLEAARQAKLDLVPVDYQEYPSEEAEWADLIGDNRIAELAWLDEARTRDLLMILKEHEGGVELAGFTAAEAEAYIAEATTPEKPPKVDIVGDLADAIRIVIVFEEPGEQAAFFARFGVERDPKRQIYPWAMLRGEG